MSKEPIGKHPPRVSSSHSSALGISSWNITDPRAQSSFIDKF